MLAPTWLHTHAQKSHPATFFASALGLPRQSRRPTSCASLGDYCQPHIPRCKGRLRRGLCRIFFDRQFMAFTCGGGGGMNARQQKHPLAFRRFANYILVTLPISSFFLGISPWRTSWITRLPIRSGY